MCNLEKVAAGIYVATMFFFVFVFFFFWKDLREVQGESG